MSRSAPRIGLILPLFSGDPAKVLGIARSAETLGYDGVFAFDHFFPPGAPADRASLEVYTTLAAVGATTRRVALGTLVTRAVLRPPGLAAKMVSTIDMVAGPGRMVVGVGSGDPIDEGEHRAFGFPMLSVKDRRAHLEEWVIAVRAVMSGRPFAGTERLAPVPGPLLPPFQVVPPVWVGGLADEVVRIAARSADGWNGWGLSPETFAAKAALLSQEAGRAGRPTPPIATWAGIVLVGEDEKEAAALAEQRMGTAVDALAWAGPAEELPGFLQELAGAGAEWAVLVLTGPPDRKDLVAERVLPELERPT
ncbi:MAG TPA: LLM class flavin-dependent oxidoreductase [Actinomycetota bacterium]|nr:LLM class flavin-dependent oxidoreductase [Actinomycetota bacterium]